MHDPSKQYFSERNQRGPKAAPLPFESVRRLVISVLDNFRERDFFQEAFGYLCVDAGDVNGTLGADPGAFFLRTLLRDGVWPYWKPQDEEPSSWSSSHTEQPDLAWESWDADTTFDMVEVLHDLVSAPVHGRHHTYNDCGWHYETFDSAAGQAEFRRDMNTVLRLGDPAYELDDRGQVVESAPEEFRVLLSAAVPDGTEHDLVTRKVDSAVARFRVRGASLDDRHAAVRDLADVLEALRDDMKAVMLSKDERELFHIANGFAIRHNSRTQRGDYDRGTWLRWAFYVYLATIHAVLRTRESQSPA